MKKGLKWFLIVLSVLVGIFVLLLLAALCLVAYENVQNKKLYGQRVELLRSSGAYQTDTNTVCIRIIRDTVRQKRFAIISSSTLCMPRMRIRGPRHWPSAGS